MTIHWGEAICGVLAAILGLGGEAFVAFGPVYNTASDGPGGETTGSASLLSTNAMPGAFVLLIGLAALFIAIGVTAVLDSRHSTMTLRTLLLVGTGLLLLSACITIASVGVLLVPSLVLAIITAMLANIPRSSNAQTGHPVA